MKQKWKKKLDDNDDAGKALRSQGETSKNGANQYQKVKKKVDMKEVQCYCCQKFGHYVRDYCYNKNKDEDKCVAQFVDDGSSDAEEVILMGATHFPLDKVNVWYLGT